MLRARSRGPTTGGRLRPVRERAGPRGRLRPRLRALAGPRHARPARSPSARTATRDPVPAERRGSDRRREGVWCRHREARWTSSPGAGRSECSRRPVLARRAELRPQVAGQQETTKTVEERAEMLLDPPGRRVHSRMQRFERRRSDAGQVGRAHTAMLAIGSRRGKNSPPAGDSGSRAGGAAEGLERRRGLVGAQQRLAQRGGAQQGRDAGEGMQVIVAGVGRRQDEGDDADRNGRYGLVESFRRQRERDQGVAEAVEPRMRDADADVEDRRRRLPLASDDRPDGVGLVASLRAPRRRRELPPTRRRCRESSARAARSRSARDAAGRRSSWLPCRVAFPSANDNETRRRQPSHGHDDATKAAASDPR